MNFYKHHIGDYDADTSHLSWIEDAAYRRLISLYYRREAPVPLDQKEAHRLVRATSKPERDAVTSVLEEFFYREEDGWHHKRCDGEIDLASKKAVINRTNGKGGGRPRKTRSGSEPRNNPDETQMVSASQHSGNLSQTPESRHQTPDTREEKDQETTKLALGRARPSVAPQLSLVEGAAKGQNPPDCPHLEVLDLWAKQLPALPEHLSSQWKGARADHLRTRWRETAVEEGWTTKEQGLVYFGRLFAYIGRSKFLTGNAPTSPGRSPFVITLAWLVKPENWAKTIEGNYHPEQQA